MLIALMEFSLDGFNSKKKIKKVFNYSPLRNNQLTSNNKYL